MCLEGCMCLFAVWAYTLLPALFAIYDGSEDGDDLSINEAVSWQNVAAPTNENNRIYTAHSTTKLRYSKVLGTKRIQPNRIMLGISCTKKRATVMPCV